LIINIIYQGKKTRRAGNNSRKGKLDEYKLVSISNTLGKLIRTGYNSSRLQLSRSGLPATKRSNDNYKKTQVISP
ncbi:hypothetical protein, partial [Planktothrix sp. FACHB-1355]|uniref:hypothetical protein n=1 Tax=Planktothrix sp. FACHB-1355 TaxID=2692854 RepID=UPI001A7E431B